MLAVVGISGRAELEQVPLPRRPAGWVRLRVLLAAICRTDVQAATGLLPLGGRRILGHEVVGEVVEADPLCAFRPGDRVAVALPLIPCADCKACAEGRRCAHRPMLGVDVDGAFADYVTVPQVSLCAVPQEMPLRRAACVEPIAAMSAVLRAPIRSDQRGLVLGSGRIADLTGRVLRAHGFRDTDTEPDPAGGYDFVVDATGTEEGLDHALRLVRPGGVVVLKSRPATPLALDVMRAVRNDITLSSVSYGPFDEAVRMAGELEIDDLLGVTYPLTRFDEALTVSREQPLGPKVFLAPTMNG